MIRTGWKSWRNWAGANDYSANLLSWVTPSSVQRVWGTHFDRVNGLWTGGERLAFSGFTVLLLAAILFVALWGIWAFLFRHR